METGGLSSQLCLFIRVDCKQKKDSTSERLVDFFMRFQEFMGFPAESHQTQTRLEKIGLRDFQPSSFDGCCIILKECFIHSCLGFVKYSLQFYMNSPP